MAPSVVDTVWNPSESHCGMGLKCNLLTFTFDSYFSWNDKIMYYSSMTPGRRNWNVRELPLESKKIYTPSCKSASQASQKITTSILELGTGEWGPIMMKKIVLRIVQRLNFDSVTWANDSFFTSFLLYVENLKTIFKTIFFCFVINWSPVPISLPISQILVMQLSLR